MQAILQILRLDLQVPSEIKLIVRTYIWLSNDSAKFDRFFETWMNLTWTCHAIDLFLHPLKIFENLWFSVWEGIERDKWYEVG